MSGELNTRAWDAGSGLINQALRTPHPPGLVRKFSFKGLLDGSISYRRSPGVSNLRVERQKAGLIDPALYASGPLVLKTVRSLANSDGQAAHLAEGAALGDQTGA